MIRIARPRFVGLILLACVASAQAQADRCGPDTRALFNFQAGDIFQYNRITWDSVGGKGVLIRMIRKLSILRRLEAADSLAYEVEVRERRLTSTNDTNDVQARYDMFRETQAYRIGPGNPFDACSGDTVSMPIGPETSESFRTEVALDKGNTGIFPLAKPDLRIKRFGYPLWTSAGLPVQDRYFFKDYAEGLGLVKMMRIGLGLSLFDSLTLIGYRKGGNTVGVIHPDADFGPATALPPKMPPQAEPFSSATNQFDLLGRRYPLSAAPGFPLWFRVGNKP